ncbi:hypothetical protein [Rhodopirellula sp. SWK7]|uniref:hypothetical protein n=1 Tax=Rhodopirellula sp. SWK7 TaxID=595460 RepID=UPI001360B384|nr:hypothetical protein [Rhodopirellula sp. SWK7]
MDKDPSCNMPHFDPEFSSPNIDFRLRHGRALLDTDYVTMVNEYPGGFSEYVIHKRIDFEKLEAINPLELLDTRTAVNVLVMLKETPGSNVNSWVLSRLLVQTLEYSRNRKHLVSDPWDEQTLKGDQLTQISNTDLAKDLKTEQRNEYRLIRSTGVAPENIETDYWSAFSKLPSVEDSFEDGELQSLSDQMLERLTASLGADGVIEIADIRKAIKSWWAEYFDDFDLQTIKRNRRKLFQRLMSVAVRQVSTMLERIAFAIVLRDASEEARATSLFKSDRERKLFELRYGALPVLGNINIGFLYDCGELHASLINDLAHALVCGETNEAWNSAEANLQEHVHLLGSVRKKATQVEAARKAERRGQYASRKPAPTVRAESQADLSAADPSEPAVLNASIHDELEAVIPFLKERDQDKVRAYIKSGGDVELAAKEVGLTKTQFKRRWKETVLKNIRNAVNEMELNE